MPQIQRLGPTTADLHYRGFSKPARKRYGSTPDFFDYSQILEEAPWNAAAGLYTEYGKALALLDSADNQMMVMAPGDETTVFYHRVDPLPYLGMSGYADGASKRAPMERRTRRVLSLIPRLSPYFQ